MPSFRSARAQAAHRVEMVGAIGEKKPASGSDFVHSLGTQRTYAVSLGLLANWAREQRLGTDLRKITESAAARWLSERSEQVGQKALDNDRLAITKGLGFSFPVVRSVHVPNRMLAIDQRTYTPAQVELILSRQLPRNALSTKLVNSAGLRAQELLTIRPASEQPATDQRDWSDDRFIGLSGHRYTVVGKGGLTREVMISQPLVELLESVRRARPISVRDRKINYLSVYDLAGGNSWSKSFSHASTQALGFSHGGHGLRHGYVQRRLGQLQALGMSYSAALQIVSQELGHFREDVTEIYLR